MPTSIRHLITCGELLAALAIATEGRAEIFIISDTPTTFAGSFRETTSFSPDDPADVVTPIYFNAFPPDLIYGFPPEFNGFGAFRGPIDNTGVLHDFVGTYFPGSPDNPRYDLSPTDTDFHSLSGRYTNGGPDGTLTVDWSFTDLHDTGGPDALFNGEFSFTVAAPEPTGSAVAIVPALGVFAFWRRRRAVLSRLATVIPQPSSKP